MGTIAMMATRRIEPGPASRQVARNVAALRTTSRRIADRLSQPQLADRVTDLGHPLAAAVLSKIEQLDRRVDVDDLVALAVALGVTPNRLLLTAAWDTGQVELSPALTLYAVDALRWANGKEVLGWPPGQGMDARTGAEITEEFLREHDPDYRTSRPPDLAHSLLGSLMAAADRGLSEESLVDLVHTAFKLRNGQTAAPLQQPATTPAASRPAVVAAIVTSKLGVLVGHRNDRTPPWTFIAGEQEPGERPEDTVVREVKEETGCLIRAGEIIGERDHPATGRHMIYMAGHPTHGTKVFVGDQDELAEVRWVSLAEAGELLPGMFEPVRAYLENTLAAPREGEGRDL